MRSIANLVAALFLVGCASQSSDYVVKVPVDLPIYKQPNECIDKKPWPNLKVTSPTNRRLEKQPIYWDWDHPIYPIDWSNLQLRPEYELMTYCVGKVVREL